MRGGSVDNIQRRKSIISKQTIIQIPENSCLPSTTEGRGQATEVTPPPGDDDDDDKII